MKGVVFVEFLNIPACTVHLGETARCNQSKIALRLIWTLCSCKWSWSPPAYLWWAVEGLNL